LRVHRDVPYFNWLFWSFYETQITTYWWSYCISSKEGFTRHASHDIEIHTTCHITTYTTYQRWTQCSLRQYFVRFHHGCSIRVSTHRSNNPVCYLVYATPGFRSYLCNLIWIPLECMNTFNYTIWRIRDF
jgi:hypothetical protein